MNDNIAQPTAQKVATPASTLIVFREANHGEPDILLVERSKAMAFAGGAIVFPGGRVDPDDHAIVIANSHVTGGGDDVDDCGARVAAIRETLEESGIAIGFCDEPDCDWISNARARLAKGELFSGLLVEANAMLNLDALTPFSRWRPNFNEVRTFDTRFYIAQARGDMPEPLVDETENVHSYWASAAAVLEAADRGTVRVIFPTRRNLERIALFGSFAEAQAQARAIAPDLICPEIIDRDGETYLQIPLDRGYPVTEEKISSAMRG
ncbi:MAG: NUDIX domain-containing protein [Sphingomonadaceae bacterium]